MLNTVSGTVIIAACVGVGVNLLLTQHMRNPLIFIFQIMESDLLFALQFGDS